MFWIRGFIPFTCSNSLQIRWMLTQTISGSKPTWQLARLVCSLASPHHHCLCELTSTASTAHPVQPTTRSRASSPALGLPDPGPPHSYFQDQLHCLAQARCRALSPDHCRGSCKAKVGSALLLSRAQEWLTCDPDNRVSSRGFQVRVQGPHSCVLQLVRGSTNSLL